MNDKKSVSSYFAKAMLHRFGDRPEMVECLFRKAGLAPETLSELPDRISAKSFATLWLAVVSELKDEFFGLDTHGMPLGSFALICRGLIQAKTVGKALELSLQYFGLFLQDLVCEIKVVGRRKVVVIKYVGQDAELQAVVIETFAILIVGLMCWLAGRRIQIFRAEFSYASPGHGDEYLLWGKNVEFDMSETRIELDPESLRLSVIPDRHSLYSFLRNAPQSVFVRFRNREGYSFRVHEILRSYAYDSWPTLERLAADFGMSLSSLRRALSREGFTYKQLKDGLRRAIAFERLRSTSLSISDIAHEVGFHEPSAFHRAFKQWTGESPGVFRMKNSVG
jgi:AraC-like DNA-binding protein